MTQPDQPTNQKIDQNIESSDESDGERPELGQTWRVKSLFSGRQLELPPNCSRPQKEKGRSYITLEEQRRIKKLPYGYLYGKRVYIITEKDGWSHLSTKRPPPPPTWEEKMEAKRLKREEEENRRKTTLQNCLFSPFWNDGFPKD